MSLDTTPRKFKSKHLGISGEVNERGAVSFEDGVLYSPAEVKEMKGASRDDIVAVHRVKMMFGGVVRKVRICK